MITVRTVEEGEKELLSGLLQRYLREMSRYYDDKADENGNFPYPYLPFYFSEESRRAYFFQEDDELIGFALINTHSFNGEKADNCIAEFTILPGYRCRGKGTEAMAALKEVREGNWQLKYSEDNVEAVRFWNRIKEKYDGREERLNEKEIVITF